MLKTNRERCYFDLRFGCSDWKYIKIHVSRYEYHTFFVWLCNSPYRSIILAKKPELMQNLRNFEKSSTIVLLGTIKICPFVQDREHVFITINRLLLIYRLEKKQKCRKMVENRDYNIFEHFWTLRTDSPSGTLLNNDLFTFLFIAWTEKMQKRRKCNNYFEIINYKSSIICHLSLFRELIIFCNLQKNSYDFDKICLWKKKTFHVWWQLCIIYILAAYSICHHSKCREVCLFYNVRFECFFIFVEKMQNFRKFSCVLDTSIRIYISICNHFLNWENVRSTSTCFFY